MDPTGDIFMGCQPKKYAVNGQMPPITVSKDTKGGVAAKHNNSPEYTKGGNFGGLGRGSKKLPQVYFGCEIVFRKNELGQ